MESRPSEVQDVLVNNFKNISLEQVPQVQAKNVPKQTIFWGCKSVKGRAFQNEDKHIAGTIEFNVKHKLYIFGIFDGHGGTFASKFCAENFRHFLSTQQEFQAAAAGINTCTNISIALTKAFLSCDEYFMAIERKMQKFESCPQGCAALVVLALEERIIVANAGDCRAVMWYASDSNINTIKHSKYVFYCFLLIMQVAKANQYHCHKTTVQVLSQRNVVLSKLVR